jgi:hypothetical protein
MVALPKPTLFDAAAVEHFLDFTRDRDIKVEIVPSYSALDMPMLRMTIPMQGSGDQRGLEALFVQMANGEYPEVGFRFNGMIYPCWITTAGPLGEAEAVLDLRVVGAPEPG